jgi:Secretion system C-terminal sorting domain
MKPFLSLFFSLFLLTHLAYAQPCTKPNITFPGGPVCLGSQVIYRADSNPFSTSFMISGRPANVLLRPTQTVALVVVTWNSPGPQTLTVTCGTEQTIINVNVVNSPALPPISQISASSNAILCPTVSLTETYTVPPQSTYDFVWEVNDVIVPGATSNQFTNTWTSSGTVSCYLTNGTCTGRRSTINVTVIQTPPPPTILGSPACVNSTNSYFITNDNPNQEYQWSLSEGGILTPDIGRHVGASITWTTPGPHTISVSASNSCMGSGPAGTLVVNVAAALPPLGSVTGPSHPCVGIDYDFFVSGPPFSSDYSWSARFIDNNNMPHDATIVRNHLTESPTIRFTEPGTYTVSVKLRGANGCFGPAVSQTFAVGINSSGPISAPILNGPPTGCLGTTSEFTTTPLPSPVEYNWTVSNIGTLQSFDPATGKATVLWNRTGGGFVKLDQYIPQIGCSKPTKILNVGVGAAIQPIISGSTVACQNAPSVYSTQALRSNYQWSVTNGTIVSGEGTNTVTVIWNALGNQTVSVNFTNDFAGCFAPTPTLHTVLVRPVPTVFTLNSETTCPGIQSALILSGSETVVFYQLKENPGNRNVGNAKQGTGSSLIWNDQLVSNKSYSILATSSANSCTSPMNGSVLIPVNNTLFFTVSGGGTLCLPDTPASINLSGSQLGISYQLKVGNTHVGSPIDGTGNPLNWTGLITAGTYTVVGTDPTTQCSRVMTGNAVVTNIGSSLFTVGGGGNICNGSNGLSITLSGSQEGIVYRLLVNGNNTSETRTGTNGGPPIGWPQQNIPGTYTVIGTNFTNGCSNMMIGSASIAIYPDLTVFSIGGGGTFCTGLPGLPITLSGSEIGVNYQLKLGATNVGLPLAGTGNTLIWNNQTGTGSYTVRAINATTNCNKLMNGVVSIQENTTSLNAYTIPTSGSTVNVCQGNSIELFAGFSAEGVFPQYLWSTGERTAFINPTQPGSYSVTITDLFGHCQQTVGPIHVNTITSTGGAITASQSCASGSSIQLTSPSGMTYDWNTGSTSQTTSVIFPGTYIVDYMETVGFNYRSCFNLKACGAPARVASGANNHNDESYNDNWHIEFKENQELSIFPNPSDTELTIQFPESGKLSFVHLIDQLGKVVCTFSTLEKSKDINTREIPNGVYLLRIETDGKIINQKIVIAHQE